jgi:hypothetical protein
MSAPLALGLRIPEAMDGREKVAQLVYGKTRAGVICPASVLAHSLSLDLLANNHLARSFSLFRSAANL